MNVRQFKKILNEIPDDWEVVVYGFRENSEDEEAMEVEAIDRNPHLKRAVIYPRDGQDEEYQTPIFQPPIHNQEE